jgi:CheY-like chemotaxis protein
MSLSRHPLAAEPHVPNGQNPRILNSWKEIAVYLGRGIRTAQRYEHDFGLPVHRPSAKMRASVIAFADELDKWLQETPMGRDGDPVHMQAMYAAPEWSSERSQQLGQATQELLGNDALLCSSLETLEGKIKQDQKPLAAERENIHILMIEDDATDVMHSLQTLKKAGPFQIQIIMSGAKAIEMLNVCPPELLPRAIILDLNLPTASGFDVLAFCRKNDKLKKIPVLVWTKVADSPAEEICRYLGAREFVRKSADTSALIKALSPLTNATASAK